MGPSSSYSFCIDLEDFSLKLSPSCKEVLFCQTLHGGVRLTTAATAGRTCRPADSHGQRAYYGGTVGVFRLSLVRSFAPRKENIPIPNLFMDPITTDERKVSRPQAQTSYSSFVHYTTPLGATATQWSEMKFMWAVKISPLVPFLRPVSNFTQTSHKKGGLENVILSQNCSYDNFKGTWFTVRQVTSNPFLLGEWWVTFAMSYVWEGKKDLGASIYEIRKISELFDLLPLSLSQISWFGSFCLLFQDPPPPIHCGRHKWKLPREGLPFFPSFGSVLGYSFQSCER